MKKNINKVDKKIDITKVRENIKQIDKQIASLFESRMKEVEAVAKYKKERALPILDAMQEDVVIDRNVGFIKKYALKKYFRDVTVSLMNVSKEYQEVLNEGLKIGFCGTYGAFSHIATRKIFPNKTYKAYQSFEETYKQVENNKIDTCVLPIENSFAGEVSAVTDLMYNGSLFINGIYQIKIVQNLLGVHGATLKDIKTIISHEQAINQCMDFIKKHNLKIQYESNTAIAAQKVEEKNDKRFAAIASMEAKEFFDLDLIEQNISTSGENYTRFAVFSATKNINKNDDTFILMFTLKKDLGSGALLKALQVFNKYKINIKSLRSRPLKLGKFKYYFYAEVEGNLENINVKKALKDLEKVCWTLKTVGSFKINYL